VTVFDQIYPGLRSPPPKDHLDERLWRDVQTATRRLKKARLISPAQEECVRRELKLAKRIWRMWRNVRHYADPAAALRRRIGRRIRKAGLEFPPR
jgi:hypothetical protein